MKIKLRTLIIAWAVIILLLLWAVKSCASTGQDFENLNLSGGTSTTKSMALWEVYKFKYTTLLRMFPYCPYKAYCAVSKYVTVQAKDNRRYLIINADLKELLKEDTLYNRQFSKAFKVRGSPKQRIRQIYKYCCNTKYVEHIKTAKEVFTLRQGDCAGIAAAFYVLCKNKHISVRYVIGWNSKYCHAWNRVKLSGIWYWVDCTDRHWLKRTLWKNYSVMEIW